MTRAGERFDFGYIVNFKEASKFLQRISNNSGLEVVLEKGEYRKYKPREKIETRFTEYKGYFTIKAHVDESVKIDFKLPLYGGAKLEDLPCFQFFFLRDITVCLNTYQPVEEQMKRVGDCYTKLHDELEKYFSERESLTKELLAREAKKSK